VVIGGADSGLLRWSLPILSHISKLEWNAPFVPNGSPPCLYVLLHRIAAIVVVRFPLISEFYNISMALP